MKASGLLAPETPADIPSPSAEAVEAEKKRAWQVGFTEQSGRLQQANDDQTAGLRLMQACETRFDAALADAGKPWWRRIF